MSGYSIYFTRGTPRSTTPAFTLDFTKEPYLKSLAERLYQQYTCGLAQPSDEREAGNFVTHGHTTFEQSGLGWVPQGEVVEEESLVMPTFTKPKPTDITLSNCLVSSSSAPPAPVQSVPPLKPAATVNATVPSQKTPTPVNSIATRLKTPTPVDTITPAQETPTLAKTTAPPQQTPALLDPPEPAPETPATVTITEPPLAAPQKAPEISREKPTRAAVTTSARKEDLRRSVALLNASRSRSEKTQPATQVTSQAPKKATKTTTSLALPDSQLSMSSSEYRPSSPSSQSSRSPTPKSPPKTASPTRRRSGRTRADPVTYNLKTLSRGRDSPNQSEREDSPVVSKSPPPSASPRPLLQLRQSSQPRPSSQVRPSLQDFPVNVQKERKPGHKPSLSRLLWTRELRGTKPSHDLVRAKVTSNLMPWKTWKGASGDVGTLAWSPDGRAFATGASSKFDEYNRRNTLLFGNISRNTLHELPDHNIPQTLNSATADGLQFPTVSTVQWVNRQLYTASYDHTVKIWNTDTLASPITPTCVRTLRHDSNVRVMDVSNSMPYLVATGTAHSFNLWNLLDKTPTPKPLEIHRDPRQKANIVLEPTVLAWGQNEATKNYLVGGMTESGRPGDEFKVMPLGHLSMWRVAESSIERRKLSPDSQNIFDLKWHPSMRRFAIGSTYSQSMNLPLRSKSVVQLYDVESGGKVVVTGKCACSAADMNEVTFCPMDSAYITASCTDGSTYVWDSRYDPRPIHKLTHDKSLDELNANYAQEYTDFGVKVALWGTTMDQFYTGGSDGYLKQWDIRRATEDALVANTADLGDGITSGAFSPDKSQLLLGTNSGAVHVLSCQYLEDEAVEFDFRHAPEPPSEEIPGIPLAKKYLASGQLTLHPIFGPVQGPKYSGPYASWARDLPKTATQDKLKRTPLLSEFQIRQFDGPPLNDRRGLDPESRREVQSQFNLARARHARRGGSGEGSLLTSENLLKRKRDSWAEFGGIDKDGTCAARKKKKKRKDKLKKHRKNSHVITRIEESIIDLTMDSDSEPVTTNSAATPTTVPVSAATGDSTMDSSCEPLEESLVLGRSLSPIPKVLEEDSDGEDYWWPDSRHVDANLGSPDDL